MAHSSAAKARVLLDEIEYGAKLRAASYSRVSTEEQTRGFGIENQDTANSEYIDRKSWHHVAAFSDEGVSGSLEMGSRPDFDRLMTLAVQEPRPMDVVVVTATDRIGRTDRAFYRWVWALEDLGIAVAVSHRDIDNTTQHGREAMRSEADYAFREYERILQRTQDGLQTKAMHGGWTGGRPPCGWYIVNKGRRTGSHLGLDDITKKGYAWMMRRAREIFIANRGNWDKTATRINLEGWLTPEGLPFNGPNLREKFLCEAVLKGTHTFRNPDSRGAGRKGGTKLKADGTAKIRPSVTVEIPRLFTDNELAAFEAVLIRKENVKDREDWNTYPLSKRLISACGRHRVGQVNGSHNARVYRCSGKTTIAANAAPRCDCSEIHADLVEKHVWEEVTQLLSQPEKLERVASDMLGFAGSTQDAHTDRIAELERRIAVQNTALGSVRASAAVEAAEMGLEPAEAQAHISEATASVLKEIKHLRKLLAEAKEWMEESQAAAQRGKDLSRLAVMARTSLPTMDIEDQLEVLALLRVKVEIQSPVQALRRGNPCPVRAWFESREQTVPLAVPDGAWERIRPLVVKGGRGSGKRTAYDLRAVVEAILFKARSGLKWDEVTREVGMLGKQLSKRYNDWVRGGIWEQIMDILADVEGVELPPQPGRTLPDLLVTGDIDPRLLLTDVNVRDQGVASGTPRSRIIRFRIQYNGPDQAERILDETAPVSPNLAQAAA